MAREIEEMVKHTDYTGDLWGRSLLGTHSISSVLVVGSLEDWTGLQCRTSSPRLLALRVDGQRKRKQMDYDSIYLFEEFEGIPHKMVINKSGVKGSR